MKIKKKKINRNPSQYTAPCPRKIQKALYKNLRKTARSRIFKKRAAKAREILESLVESKAEPAIIM